MAQAYDFALDKIGMDIHSYSIWNDYVMFLKSVEAVGIIIYNNNKFNVLWISRYIIIDDYRSINEVSLILW